MRGGAKRREATRRCNAMSGDGGGGREELATLASLVLQHLKRDDMGVLP